MAKTLIFRVTDVAQWGYDGTVYPAGEHEIADPDPGLRDAAVCAAAAGAGVEIVQADKTDVVETQAVSEKRSAEIEKTQTSNDRAAYLVGSAEVAYQQIPYLPEDQQQAAIFRLRYDLREYAARMAGPFADADQDYHDRLAALIEATGD